jgi:hypothetical protein
MGKQSTDSTSKPMSWGTEQPTASKSDANPKEKIQSSDKMNPVGDAASAPKGMYKPTKTSY